MYEDSHNRIYLDRDDMVVEVDGDHLFRCHRLDIETISSQTLNEVVIETYSGPYVKLFIPEDGDVVRLMTAVQDIRE